MRRVELFSRSHVDGGSSTVSFAPNAIKLGTYSLPLAFTIVAAPLPRPMVEFRVTRPARMWIPQLRACILSGKSEGWASARERVVCVRVSLYISCFPQEIFSHSVIPCFWSNAYVSYFFSPLWPSPFLRLFPPLSVCVSLSHPSSISLLSLPFDYTYLLLNS